MASNVSNLLKEKIVTPVANSLATQVDNKVKNGIILRKFIGVQLGESNTGCQLIKIDLNKINVKDPSYEFTLYIKAFSQKGLFNFIVNVNKTDSLQVDVKCEVKNSDSNNGEAIGYYDVDAVGNTITISLLKAFVVNTSINECKFVSTKDTLNISDLDIDWSDTGNVKNDTSIDIKGKESNIEIDVDKYLNIDCGTLGENQRYRIATIDYSKLSEAKYFDGTSGSSTGNSIGCFVRIKIASNLMGMMILEFRPLLLSIIDLSSARVILESKGMLTFSIDSDRGNIGAFLYKRENKSIQIFYNNDLFPTTSKDTIHVFSCEIISLNAKLDPDTIKVTFDMDTTIVTDTLNEIDLENDMNLYKVFTTDVNSMGGPSFNGLVPGPNKNEADNKYLLGADAKWHPRKAVNDSFIDLEPDDTIKGLDIEDATKAVSFVTFNFNNIVTKLTELSKNSTGIYFEMELETTASLSNDYHINGKFMVNKSGLIPTTVYTTSLTQIDNRNGYLENPTALYNELIDTPGFYIMDFSLKTVTFALYTVLANSTVRIKDFYIHVDESVISLEDLTIEWKLLAIDKPEWVILRVQKFINGSLIPPTRIFEQMNIETPIDEADSFTLEKERVKNNGLVPAPGKYEVDNGYVLGADAKWHPRKAGNEYIANLKPTEEIKGLSETDTTKGISFVTIDFNTLSQKVVEAAPSTVQEFMINMKVLTRDLGIITISTKLSVTTTGLIACNGVLSDHGMGSNTDRFSTIYSAKLGAVTSPGFFVNDKDTKIFKIALYTPIAINGVKIIDAVVTSYSDIIDEGDITFTWELGILEKKPYQALRSNIIYSRIALDRELVFDQMNIETPISETDEDTLFAEQIKHNGLVPAPGKYEVDNKYLLGADAKWHPRKAGNEYIANLKPTEEILGLTETDTTKGVSFVTIDFNTLSQKIVEATPSTYQEFGLDMKVLVKQLGVVDINVNFSVTVTGVIACTGVTSNRGLNSGNFSITFDSKIGSIPSPGFFVNDYDTKIFKLALYTVFANNGVKIIDAQITSYSDLIDENDIICTWELGVLDKLPAQIGKSNEIYLGVDLPRDQTFRQMNIETPITETEETTVEAEQLKYNGLVPAPGKYEVENQYFLKADGTWDLPKNSINDYIALVTPSEEMVDQTGTTTGVSFVTIDYSKAYEKLSLATNETTGFKLYLTIFNERYGKLEIGLRTIIVNLGENINQGVIPYADTGTYPSTHLGQVQSNYGEDIRTPIFTDIDPTTHKIRVGIYAVGTNKPVIVKNCTIHQTYDTIDTHDIDIVWEANVVTFSEENTTSALQYINMNWGRAFSPILWMMNPEGSYSDSQVRKWRRDYNGFVPAPAKYEADQGLVLCADGSWIPTRGNNNSVSVVTPSEEMTSQVSSTVGITFATFDYSKIIESLSLAVNTGSGFEGILIINTKLFGEILINFSVSLFNLAGTVNKNATAYANVGTKSADHNSQISLIQNTYGADIKTPVFIYNDSVNNICKIGLYGSASRFPVIIKDCTLNQTYTDFDVNDITITWEPTTITISEENTNDASLFTNMDWSKTFTPIANMTDPDGSYSENNIRRWKLQNNGLVPAPTKYEADQGYVLYADGTWGPIKGIIRNRTFTVTPHTDSSSTQTNDYVITEGAEDLAIAINENYSVDINIVFSGLGSKNNTNTTLTITGVTGTVNLYDCSGNPIKYITDGMSMKCTIFKNTIDDPVESMNAYCIYDIVSYPDTINGPSE